MAKSDKIKGMLGNKSPSELRRQGVQQIDILKEAAAALTPTGKENDKPDEQSRSVKEPDISEKEKRDVEPPTKTVVESSSMDPSVKPIESTSEKKRSPKQRQETDRKNRSTSRRKPKVFSSKDVQAVLELDKRETERYSFEIYSDQKEDIQAICDLYEQATGKKL